MCTQKALRIAVTSIVGAALLLAPAGSAEAGERKWRLRVVGAVVGGDGGFTLATGDYGPFGTIVEGGAGVGVNFEYRYSKKMGFEMGAMAVGASLGVRSGSAKTGLYGGVDIGGFVPLTFALNYHPLKEGAFDLYVGPLLTSTFYSNLGVGGPWRHGVELRSGVEFGLGGTLGFDVNLGRSRWSLNSGLKYIALSSNGSGGGVNFDPLIFSFGFGFRF